MNAALNHESFVQEILKRLNQQGDVLRREWENSAPVQHFVVDGLLPDEWVVEVERGFPEWGLLNRHESIRERKSSSSTMEHWGEVTRDCFTALQDERVLKCMSEITGIRGLVGDLSAYAGGISCMAQGDFLNPHLDNSTHPKIEGYRRLNALFYVTPGWGQADGGNLELWAKKLKDRKEVVSAFNRLVVMNTNLQSLHSVNRVSSDKKFRKCVSNYYFTKESPHGYDYHHITSFRGRPEEPLKDVFLQIEGKVGSWLQSLKGRPLK